MSAPFPVNPSLPVALLIYNASLYGVGLPHIFLIIPIYDFIINPDDALLYTLS